VSRATVRMTRDTKDIVHLRKEERILLGRRDAVKF
jgi:hypothetical protein